MNLPSCRALAAALSLALLATAAPARTDQDMPRAPVPQLAPAAPAKAAPSYVTLNPTFRKLAALQGVIDAKADWPMRPRSGDTGGHPGYGWTLKHLLSDAWVRSTIQCFASRPVYYDGAPMRVWGGYEICGRPTDYVPESPDDLPTGQWRAPGGLLVSGPDPEHFQLEALFTVADSTGFTVATPAGPRPAEQVARELLRQLLRTHAGMLRTDTGITSYAPADRPAMYLLRNFTDGALRNLVDPVDLWTFTAYLKGVLLPSWEAGIKGRVYNGVAWALPAIRDTWAVCPDPLLRARLGAVRLRMAQCEAQLAGLVPGQACQVDEVEEWGPGLTREGVKITDWYEPWEIRAMLCAAEALSEVGAVDAAASCTKEAQLAMARWKGKPEGPGKTAWRPWFMAADRSILPGVN